MRKTTKAVVVSCGGGFRGCHDDDSEIAFLNPRLHISQSFFFMSFCISWKNCKHTHKKYLSFFSSIGQHRKPLILLFTITMNPSPSVASNFWIKHIFFFNSLIFSFGEKLNRTLKSILCSTLFLHPRAPHPPARGHLVTSPLCVYVVIVNL